MILFSVVCCFHLQLALAKPCKEHDCFTCEFNVYKHSDESFSKLRCMSVGAEDSLSLEYDWLSSTRSHLLHVGHHCLQDFC